MPAYIWYVRTLESADLGIPNPAGLAFFPRANTFYVLEARGAFTPPSTDIIKVTPYTEPGATARIAASIPDSINKAYDSTANRLIIEEDDCDLKQI